MRAALAGLVVAIAIALAPSTAAADQVGVLPFEGKGAKAVRARVIRVLEQKKLDPIDVDQIGELPEAKAYVRGTVDRKGKRWRLRVQIIDARSGRTLVSAQMLARRRGQLPRQVSRLLWRRTRAALGKARPARARAEAKATAKAKNAEEREADQQRDSARARAEQPAQAKADEPAETRAEATPDAEAAVTATAHTAAPRALTLGIESRIYSRRLRYRDDLFGALYGHTSDGTVEVAVHADYRVTPWLSAAGQVALTRPFDSALDGAPFPTSGAAYRGGARVHLPSEALGLALEVGGRSMTFGTAGDTMERPPLPDVRYRFARAGADARRPLGASLVAGASAGYRYVYGAGMIATEPYFPRLDVAAVDGEVWLAYRLAPAWRVRVGVELERYFFAMNPEPGDTSVAGGAIDQYLSVGARLELTPF